MLVAVHYYLSLAQMGGCIPDNPTTARQGTARRPNLYNPIQRIIGQYDTNQLEQRWKKTELKTMRKKMLSVRSETISYPDFQTLFPKIKQYSSNTQLKIYDLFSYENNQVLSKKQLFKALTLIRKVPSNSDFAPFLFYVYTEDSRHERMTMGELTLFKQQNQKFKKEGEDLSQQVQEYFDNETEKISKSGLKSSPEIKSNGGQIQSNIAVSNEVLHKDREISLAQFIKIFEGYNLVAYQIMFSWDEEEEEKDLLAFIQKEGIVRKKGDKVFVLDYTWWIEWITYMEQKYGKRIELTQDNAQNYHSAKNIHRRSSVPRPIEPFHNATETSLPPPGEIKNHCLLRKTKDRGTELIPNLVELDNIICLPEQIWNRLVLIYHGGPPIERIYPEIYRRFLLKAALNSQGKFIPRQLKKYVVSQCQKIQDFNFGKPFGELIPYYKHPGKANWQKLVNDPNVYGQILNYPRTYFVLVKPSLELFFQSNYNIQELSTGKHLKKRLKNYGSDINISVEGVLTRAEVTEIISNDEIKVLYLNQEGTTESKIIKIDQNLFALNPDNLDSLNKINQLAGLNNLGNTCYMNAVLQCLIRTPYFGKYLQKENFKQMKQELLLQELAKIYNDSKSSRLETVSTRSFKRVLDRYCPFFEGNLQHDAQEFLICLLERISEEIKSIKQQYGSKTLRSELSDEKPFNKKVVKFFSGKTEAITTCLRCKNQNTRVQPFFTYSLSLPELKETEYFYYFIQSPRYSKSSIPVRYGVSLDRKVTVEKFLQTISRLHKKPLQNLALYTVFNNEILSHLESRTWQNEVSHYLSFNVKLVCFEVQHIFSPTYYHYKDNKLADKSVKIELRQRIYSEKTHDYQTVYMPYILEVGSSTKWKDLVAQVDLIITKLLPAQPNSLQSTPFKNSPDVKISQSSIRVQLNDSPLPSSDTKRSGSELKQHNQHNSKAYKIRFIKNDHYYQNYCVFCKQEFVLSRRSRSSKVCTGEDCSFTQDVLLFDDQEFRNINDLIIIVVDWLNLPEIPQSVNHRSYDQANFKAQNRKNSLEDLMVNSFKSAETLELRCEKGHCKYEYAERIERIQVPPNILLLHLKRFRYEDNRLVKLTNNVLYPPKLTLPGTNQQYELYGVVVHYGSGVGGHYISYVKVNQKWYLCDDSKVSLAAPAQHIDTNAYLLFYHKIDFEPSLICLSF